MSNSVITPYRTFRDSNGLVRANGKVTFFVNNTTTVSSIYSDESLTVAQNNPYTLDAYGRLTGDVKYIGLMTMQETNSDGSDVVTTDNVATTTGSIVHLSINNQTASYTLVAADDGKLVEMEVATANNLTIPPNSDVDFDLGTTILITQKGAGITTLVAGAGVTLNSPASLIFNTQHDTAALVQTATDEWLIGGGIL